MNILIDYENVGNAGIIGIDTLDEKDKVELFFSDKNNTMAIDTVFLIRNCKCELDLIKTDKTAPQYMDIQIICRACQLLDGGEEKVAIISKDKGYISAYDFHKKNGKIIILAGQISEIGKAVLPVIKPEKPVVKSLQKGGFLMRISVS